MMVTLSTMMDALRLVLSNLDGVAWGDLLNVCFRDVVMGLSMVGSFAMMVILTMEMDVPSCVWSNPTIVV